MRNRWFGLTTLAAFALVGAAMLWPDVSAQERQRRPSRRTTNPVAPQPAVPVPSPLPSPAARTTRAADDVTLVSSADQDTPVEETRPARRSSRARRGEQESEEESLRRTVNRLSTQVRTLSEDLGELKEQQRTIADQQRALVDLERLSRAEQRAEGFRAQLRDVLEKELAQQARSEQLDYEMQPEQVERRAAMTGTLNPAALRDQIRRQLESEKRRTQQQLELLTTSRARLEAAIVSADSEVERLRARMQENERRDAEAGTNANQNTPTQDIIRPATPRPTPTPTQTEPDNIPH